ncbi:unnamed protein product [Meganyctiphanes norvegica]|uniref:Uncharacterized protein n=1 Tax=Meganyctiphanes norvegica TaxID=48144 RepID=A0AAV2Q8V6_MEGNR
MTYGYRDPFSDVNFRADSRPTEPKINRVRIRIRVDLGDINFVQDLQKYRDSGREDLREINLVKSGEDLGPGAPNGERDHFSGKSGSGKRVRDFEGREDLREINLLKNSGRSI